MQRSNAHEHIELEDDPSSHYELKDSMRKSLAPKLSGSDLTYDSKEPSTFPAWGKKIEMALMSVEPQVTLLVHIVNLIVGRALTNEKVEAATLPEALMNPKLAWIAPGNSDPREATEQTLQQHSSDGSSQRDSFEHLSHESEYQRPTTRAESAQRGRDSDAEQTPPPQTREHFERPPGLPGHSEGERIYASPTKSKSSIYNPALKYQYSSVQDLPPAVVELNYYLFNILLSLITGPKAVEIANFPSAHRCYTSVMVFLYEEDNVSITSRKWSSYKALLEMEYNGDPLSWSSTVIERVRDLYTSEFSIQDIVMFNLQRMFAGKNSDISLMITQDIQDLSKWKPGDPTLNVTQLARKYTTHLVTSSASKATSINLAEESRYKPSSDYNGQEVPSGIVCGNCKETGKHFRRNCPLPDHGPKCDHCLQKGHLVADCRKKKREDFSVKKEGSISSNIPQSAASVNAIFQAEQRNIIDLYNREVLLQGAPVNLVDNLQDAAATEAIFQAEQKDIIDFYNREVLLQGDSWYTQGDSVNVVDFYDREVGPRATPVSMATPFNKTFETPVSTDQDIPLTPDQRFLLELYDRKLGSVATPVSMTIPLSTGYQSELQSNDTPHLGKETSLTNAINMVGSNEPGPEEMIDSLLIPLKTTPWHGLFQGLLRDITKIATEPITVKANTAKRPLEELPVDNQDPGAVQRHNSAQGKGLNTANKKRSTVSSTENVNDKVFTQTATDQLSQVAPHGIVVARNCKQGSPNTGPTKSTSIHFRFNTYVKKLKPIEANSPSNQLHTPEPKLSLDQDEDDTPADSANDTPLLKRPLNKQQSQGNDAMNGSPVKKRVTRSSAENKGVPVFMVQAEPNSTQLFEPGWYENLTAEQARSGVGIYRDPEIHTHITGSMRDLKITTEASTSPTKSISNFNQDNLSTTDIHGEETTVCNAIRTLESLSKSHPTHDDPPREWCDSLEGPDMDSTPINVPRVINPPRVQNTPRARDLLSTFSLEMDSSVSEAELPIQGTDKNQSLSDAWESQTSITPSTGSIIDSGAGRHICNLVNLTDKNSSERLRGFNGTLEHTSGKGYKSIKVLTDAGKELHLDIDDVDYFPTATVELLSMCKLIEAGWTFSLDKEDIYATLPNGDQVTLSVNHNGHLFLPHQEVPSDGDRHLFKTIKPGISQAPGSPTAEPQKKN